MFIYFLEGGEEGGRREAERGGGAEGGMRHKKQPPPTQSHIKIIAGIALQFETILVEPKEKKEKEKETLCVKISEAESITGR